ncbi:MAG: hypothetical protein Q4A74_00470 [Cardiobacteriaceae bacterium]|nr:hypothetical protein [Cardiobacteriaceae bacterium]
MKQINIMLVPTEDEYLVFPAEIVAHVFPYAPPLLVDDASEFVIGGLLIQSDKLPLLDLFADEKSAQKDGRSSFRVVLISAISTQSRFRQYAILSHGEPLIMNAAEEDIKSLGKGNHRYASRYVSLAGHDDGKRIILPNLMALEAELTMS